MRLYYFIFFLFTLFSSSASHNLSIKDSCDIITLTDGRAAVVRVIEIGITEIKYKSCDDPSGPLRIVLKENVYSIYYKNGRKEIFNADSAPRSPSNHNRSGQTQYEGFAITAMVLGILGFGPLPIIFGAIGLGKINANPQRWAGRGMANAGIILGIIWTAIIILYIIF